MNLKQIGVKKNLITSNKEDEIFNNSHRFSFNNISIKFKFEMLEGLEDFEKKVSPLLFSSIIHQLPNIKKGLITYKSEEGLKVYIQETELYFFVFSVGEYQYGLYKIYLEGIFEKLAI